MGLLARFRVLLRQTDGATAIERGLVAALVAVVAVAAASALGPGEDDPPAAAPGGGERAPDRRGDSVSGAGRGIVAGYAHSQARSV